LTRSRQGIIEVEVIEITKGNLLEAPVEALVNTVNTQGIMGKGIALQFKQAFPEMFRDYEKACKAGEVQLGKMHVFDLGGLAGAARWIVNFPTKGHWRERSRLTDIEAGLEDLVTTILRLGIRSIAIPPLGCGNGGLNWAEVRPRIEAAFTNLPDVNVLLFEPESVAQRSAPNSV
jgi:O-acetyl-ADP-ribose deacetylase (regulator of RNase III)